MISDRLRALRKARGWTQERLAVESGIKLRQIGRYEAEDEPQTPGGKKLAQLAKALGVTTAEILGERVETAVTVEDPAALVEFLNSPIGQKTTDEERAYLRSGHHALYGMTAESYQNLLAAYRASQRGRTVATASSSVNDDAKARVAAKGGMLLKPTKKARRV